MKRMHVMLRVKDIDQAARFYSSLFDANSDKTWVVDQQGVSWEAFQTTGEAETYFEKEEAA